LQGFEYLAKEYDISNTKQSIYKAICTRDITKMGSFFSAIDDEVPTELCELMAFVISGDIDSLATMILHRIMIERQNAASEVTWDNVHKFDLNKDLDDEHDNLLDYLKVFISLIEGESFDLNDLKLIFGKCRINPSVASIFVGFSSIINRDYSNTIEMIKYQEFEGKYDTHLAEAIILLASKDWKIDHIKLIFENLIRNNNLYPYADPKEKVEEMIDDIEFDMIMDLVEATEGSVQDLGQV
jgi:hypothetical protein